MVIAMTEKASTGAPEMSDEVIRKIAQHSLVDCCHSDDGEKITPEQITQNTIDLVAMWMTATRDAHKNAEQSKRLLDTLSSYVGKENHAEVVEYVIEKLGE